MSHLDSILGLPDLSIEYVKCGQIVEVWCKPKVRPACIHCQQRVSDILCKRGSFTAEAFFPQT